MNLTPLLRQRFFDANGLPLAGGFLYAYQAGTTTPQATYSNSTGTTNANPIVLDSNGYADVWIDPTLTYKFILKDSGSNVLWTVDNVAFPLGVATWSTNTIYSQGSIVQDASGQGLLYVSLTNNNQGNALTNVSAWRAFDGYLRTVSVNTTLTVTDQLVRSNSTSGSLTHTLPVCSTTPIGKKITIKDVGTGGNATSVKGSGSDLVDGNNTYASTLRANYAITVQNTGTTWDVIAKFYESVAPTTQKFTSGSGTYTTPTSPRTPLYIRVTMVGGGGGGGCNGVTTPATAGGNTTFGAQLTAGGGGRGGDNSGSASPGNGNGGTGGTVTNSTGLNAISSPGNPGNICLSGFSVPGASTFLGGAGAGTFAASANGGNATANTGSGGGAGYNAGSGGSGASICIVITGPSATYSYAVGAAGAGGLGSGANGGNGGSGMLMVEEHYE